MFVPNVVWLDVRVLRVRRSCSRGGCYVRVRVGVRPPKWWTFVFVLVFGDEVVLKKERRSCSGSCLGGSAWNVCVRIRVGVARGWDVRVRVRVRVCGRASSRYMGPMPGPRDRPSRPQILIVNFCFKTPVRINIAPFETTSKHQTHQKPR